MDFPTGHTGRDGWDPAPAAAVCVCVQRVHLCSVPSIISHLLPERGVSAVVMPSIACLPWAFFFFLFCLSSYSKFASGGGGRWGVA